MTHIFDYTDGWVIKKIPPADFRKQDYFYFFGLTSTFRKTLVVICQNSWQHNIRLKTFLIVSSSYTWFSIHKYLFKQNILCWIIWWHTALIRKNFAYQMFRENIGQWMKSKQLSFIEKFICLAILSANPVRTFSEIYLFYSFNFTTNKNSSYFSKMALEGSQYNEVCFKEEQDIPNTLEKSRKSQSVTKWYRWEVMHTNVEHLSCGWSSPSKVFLAKVILKICIKFTGEHPTLLKLHFGMGVLL